MIKEAFVTAAEFSRGPHMREDKRNFKLELTGTMTANEVEEFCKIFKDKQIVYTEVMTIWGLNVKISTSLSK